MSHLLFRSRVLLIASMLLAGLCAGQIAAQDDSPSASEGKRFFYIPADKVKIEEGPGGGPGGAPGADAVEGEEKKVSFIDPLLLIPNKERETGVTLGEDTEDPQATAKKFAVVQQAFSGTEYEALKAKEILRWTTIYADFLRGNFTAHTGDGITAQKAQEMVSIGQTELQAIMANPDRLQYTAELMAGWAFYYEQLALWNKYVEERVLHDELPDGEKVSFDPVVARGDRNEVYDKMKGHAKEIEQKQKDDYEEMTAAIEQNQLDDSLYLDWIERHDRAMEQFAKRWARMTDASGFKVGDKTYVVRNKSEAPLDPGLDTLKNNLPQNAKLLEVPMERRVTPADLINEDGSLKDPPA